MEKHDFTVENSVRFRDVDAMGLVNHAVLISFLEEARTKFLMDLLNFDDLGGIDFLIASVSCDFRSPASYNDELETGVKLTDVGDSSFTLDYTVRHRSENRTVADASTVQVFYDYGREESKPVPDRFRRAVDQNIDA